MKLQYDEALSTFAFKFNLRRYIKARAAPTLQVRTTPGPEGIRSSGDAVTPKDTFNEDEKMAVSPAVARAASKWMSKVAGSKAGAYTRPLFGSA